MKFLFSVLTTVLLSQGAIAHPVSYKGALGVMTWNQPFLSDHWVTYSFDPQAAIAARAMRMEMPTGEFIAYFPQLDYLLKRWNKPASQGNIYLYGGYGGAKLNDINGSAGQVGIEADWESRSFFILGKWEAMRSDLTEDFHHGEFRIGAAPYEAEFNEIASWLMIQVQYHPTLMERFAVTPLMRLFYKSVLWELGVSTKSEWMMNFMFHF